MYGLCHLSMVPLRAEPSEKAEMISQLLFGDYVVILQEQSSWLKVQCVHDHYEGWVDRKQMIIDLEPKEALAQSKNRILVDVTSIIETAYGNRLISIGSSIPEANRTLFPEGASSISHVIAKGTDQIREELPFYAQKFLGTPYLWGGRSLFGIDCSGLMQVLFKLKGKSLPRDAYQQAEQGTTINLLQEAKACDLAFFDNEEGRIVHVGLMLNAQEIIHASGEVRIDAIDHQGIFNRQTQKYSHKLRIIKRLA
jgi:cell wall-associated NlpC family hydrolase